MSPRNNNKVNNLFDKFAHKITLFTGSTTAFAIAFSIIVLWVISGPIFKYSDTWQLVINTSTTIVTFLMVFLIQRSQNKDSMAIQLKLNELIATSKTASNWLIDIEDLTEEELQILEEYYRRMSEKTKEASNIKKSHSRQGADDIAESKLNVERNRTGIKRE